MTQAEPYVLQKEDRILFGLEPFRDESFFGFTARLAEHNHFDGRRSFLARIGFEQIRKQGLEEAVEHPGRSAWRLRLTEDQLDQLTARDDPEGAEFRMLLDVSRRRISPAGLRSMPYHRVSWASKLPYCQETWEVLVQDCPACKYQLGWTRGLRVEFCERCGFDLRSAPTLKIPARQRKMLALMAALIDRDQSNRRTPLPLLPPHLADCSPFLIFELAMVFARVTALRRPPKPPSYTYGGVKNGAQDAADMATGMEILVRYPESFDERMNSGNSVLPDFFKLARSRAGKRCVDIVTKLIFDWEPCRHGPSRLRAKREEAGQLTLREAARELKLENGDLRCLIDQGLVGAPAGRGVLRKIQWLDPASIHDAGRRLNERMSIVEFAQAYRVPVFGVAQLISIGLLSPNLDPIVQALHSGVQLDRGVAVGLADRLLALGHVPAPKVALWALEDVFHGIGGQEKPWAAIVQAALKREIILYCDDQSSEGLHVGRLRISQSLAHEILARARPELLLAPEISVPLWELEMTRTDIERYLNCFPRDLSWLIAEGHLHPRPRRDEVEGLGRSLISSREINWRWRVSPSFREAMAKGQSIRRAVGPFWEREAVERYFAEVFPMGRPV